MHDAVREALVNCLVNADFYQGWNVVIEKYPDKIVMANPGTILTGKRQMLKGGISQPRNKGLFKMFNLIGLGEHAGSGVPDIFKAWKDAGLKRPIIEEKFGGGEPDRTILTLPTVASKKSANKPTNKSANLSVTDTVTDTVADGKGSELLAIMEVGKEYKARDLAEQVGVKGTRTRVLLKKLVDSGKIEAQGKARARRYIRRQ